MSELSDAFLIRARESLLGAESEFVNGHCDNAANRAYYACFQAAIAALVLADNHSPGRQDEWGHEFVQSRFEGVLIVRRKQYLSDLRSTIPESRSVRHQGDYRLRSVTRSQPSRALNRATHFVMAVEQARELR